jgi:arylsulfatase A-like enzyme
MLNAQHAGRRLELPDEGADLMAGLLDNWGRLGLRTGVPGSQYRSVKHVFDTRFFDECFRRIAEYLAERDPERDTVTVVLSDHGLSFSEHGELGYLHSGGRPHEYLTRVPLLLQFPPESELAALHGRYDQPVSLTDLFSTILDLGLGADVFERELPIRGQSLIRRLRNNTFDDLLVTEAALLPMPYQEWPGVVAYSKAVYADGMKLIFAPKLLQIADGKTWWPFQLRLDAEPTAWEQGQRPPEHEALAGPLALLYDLTADPAERRNLAKKAPETVARLRDLVDGSWSCEPAGTAPTRVDFDPDALETLRALGYVQAPPPSRSRR